MKEIHKKRLLKLAEFLEERVPEARFNMDFWALDDDGRIGAVPLASPKCKTAACALGWATALFPRSLALTEGPRYADVVHLATGKRNEQAAQEFFGLTFNEVRLLFMSSFDMNSKEKATQIRKFVATA